MKEFPLILLGCKTSSSFYTRHLGCLPFYWTFNITVMLSACDFATPLTGILPDPCSVVFRPITKLAKLRSFLFLFENRTFLGVIIREFSDDHSWILLLWPNELFGLYKDEWLLKCKFLRFWEIFDEALQKKAFWDSSILTLLYDWLIRF